MTIEGCREVMQSQINFLCEAVEMVRRELIAYGAKVCNLAEQAQTKCTECDQGSSQSLPMSYAVLAIARKLGPIWPSCQYEVGPDVGLIRLKHKITCGWLGRPF